MGVIIIVLCVLTCVTLHVLVFFEFLLKLCSRSFIYYCIASVYFLRINTMGDHARNQVVLHCYSQWNRKFCVQLARNLLPVLGLAQTSR